MKIKSTLFKTLAIDFLAAAVCLCIFAYFHHVRRLWNLDGKKDPDVIEVIEKPTQSSGTSHGGSETNSDATDSSATESDATDSSSTEDEDLGQFGEKFSDMFAKNKDEYISSENEYKSHDIYISLTRKEETVEGNEIKYYVYDIYVRNIENLFTEYSMTERRLFADMIKDCSPVAAVSGDYCGNENAAYVVVRNGKVLRKEDTVRFDLCVLGWDGNMTVIKPDEYSYKNMLELSPYQAWNFGPILVKNGKAMTYFNHRTDIAGYNPRVAIGCVEAGHYIFLVVDGDAGGDNGMKLGMTAKILKSYNCVTGYNLDGGASAHGSFNEEILRNGHPSSSTPRTLYDIICIGEISK